MPRRHEFRFWSPILGCDAARICMVIPPSTPGRPRDPREGAEYFTIIAADVPGSVYREPAAHSARTGSRRSKMFGSIVPALSLAMMFAAWLMFLRFPLVPPLRERNG